MTAPIIGGVYWVGDELLSLPPNGERTLHPRRIVVVISGPDTNSEAAWPVVVIMPISSETTRKTRFCVKLAAGEGNVTKKCWVRVPAVQPLLKTDLLDFVGVLAEDKLEEIQARLWQYLGLAADEA